MTSFRTQRADGSVYPISRHTYDGLDMLTDTCLMIMSTSQEGKGGCVNQTQWDTYTHAKGRLLERKIVKVR